MADVAEVLATYDALVGVALGAGLTYVFGAINRRHQETRENETRWYEERLRAYIAYYQAAFDIFFRIGETSRNKVRISHEEFERLAQRLLNDLGTVQLVGSPEVIEAAEKAFEAAFDQLSKNRNSGHFSGDFLDDVEEFRRFSRKDLGHPSEPLSLPSNDFKGMSVYQKRPP